MKVRIGFVSNSSTSSFCILGYKVDTEDLCMERKMQIIGAISPSELKDLKKALLECESEDDKEDTVEELFIDISYKGSKVFDTINDGEGGVLYLGATLCDISSDDGGAEEEEIDIDEALAKAEKARVALKLKGKPKIYSGMMAS